MMLKKLFPLLLVPALLGVPVFAQNKAVIPANKLNTSKNWKERHERFLAQARKGGIDLLFVGDSLTANWEKEGAAVWEKHYGKINAANIGIGGDETGHLLWRLQNGEIDGLSPKVAVLLIGANNMAIKLKFTPGQIAEGIATNIAELRKRLPKTTILLASILPRATPMNDWLNRKNIAVNKLLPSLADEENVIHLDIWKSFLGADGEAAKEFYRDTTHLTAKGYARYAAALQPYIDKYLKP